MDSNIRKKFLDIPHLVMLFPVLLELPVLLLRVIRGDQTVAIHLTAHDHMLITLVGIRAHAAIPVDPGVRSGVRGVLECIFCLAELEVGDFVFGDALLVVMVVVGLVGVIELVNDNILRIEKAVFRIFKTHLLVIFGGVVVRGIWGLGLVDLHFRGAVLLCQIQVCFVPLQTGFVVVLGTLDGLPAGCRAGPGVGGRSTTAGVLKGVLEGDVLGVGHFGDDRHWDRSRKDSSGRCRREGLVVLEDSWRSSLLALQSLFGMGKKPTSGAWVHIFGAVCLSRHMRCGCHHGYVGKERRGYRPIFKWT
jgi:hypothetical protein